MTVTINRPLTDAEKDLLAWLAVQTVATQAGVPEETAAAALEAFTEDGRAEMRGDSKDVYVVIAGKVLVHISREYLAFGAHTEEWETPA